MRKGWLMVTIGLVLAIAVSGVAIAGLSRDYVNLVINGRAIRPDVPLQIVDGRTMAPVRWVAEALGAKVDWDEAARTVTVTSDGNQMRRVELLERALAPQSAVEAACAWAESIKTRNGALQYALMAPGLRNEGFDAPGWATGWSSPWVENYEVEFDPKANSGDAHDFNVRFFWWTSAGSGGSTETQLKVKRFDDIQGSPYLITETKVLPQKGTKPEVNPGNSGTLDRIPFLSVERSGIGREIGAYPVHYGMWDLANGQLSFSNLPLFEIRDPNQNGIFAFAWDGGERIVVSPEPGQELELKQQQHPQVDPQQPAEVVPSDPFFGCISAPGDSDGMLIVRMLHGADTAAELEIRENTGKTETVRAPLVPDFGTEISLFRPIAVERSGESAKVYFETTRSSASGQIAGLAEAAYAGGNVTWRVIASDLDITEAGAGTRMTKFGNFIYIGQQERLVQRVDISTGKVESCKAINEALAQFARKYAPFVEFVMPPTLYSYGDTLIVCWRPPALEDELVDGRLQERIIPVGCVLAVKGEHVCGQMMTIKDKTYVLQGETVNQVLVSSNPDTALSLVFPN